MKHKIWSSILVASCILSGNAAFAATELKGLDCRHLFAEDVHTTDLIVAMKKKQAASVASGQDSANDGFFVKFDPIPGIGVMEGETLYPSGHKPEDDVSDEKIHGLEGKLSEIRHLQEQKVCPTVSYPKTSDDRLLDE